MRKKQFFCKKKNENTYDQVEKVWWYESLLSLGEPTSSDFGEGDKQWFGAHGPDYQLLCQTLMGATLGFLGWSHEQSSKILRFFPNKLNFKPILVKK